MFRFLLLVLLTSVSVLSISGCTQTPEHSPVAAHHTPEILIFNRADKTQQASTPWVKGALLNFPAIDPRVGPYWIIFVDQTPCEPLYSSMNPLAFPGTPGAKLTCKIANDPPAGGHDRHFRYALWPATLGPMPPFEQVYGRAKCSPICP